jgi:hypothetical protein
MKQYLTINVYNGLWLFVAFRGIVRDSRSQDIIMINAKEGGNDLDRDFNSLQQ